MTEGNRVVKVLYVDDRDEIRRVFQRLMKLAVAVDTEVFLASDGEEGVQTALREKPDIVFMDAKMPVMDGIEATRLLKECESLRDVPVVMISAYADRLEKREEAEEAGVAFFIGKPFTPEELEVALRRTLGL